MVARHVLLALLASASVACATLADLDDATYDPNLDGGAGGSSGGSPSGGQAGQAGQAGAGGGSEGGAGVGGAGEGGAGGAGQGGAGAGGVSGAGAGGAGMGGAGTAGGGQGGAGQGGSGDEFDTCEGGATYVSAMGNDGNSGKTPQDPKRSIQAGIDAAADKGKVCICQGTYSEKDAVFVAKKPVSLLGGYDCTTWKRSKSVLSGPLDNKTILAPTSIKPDPNHGDPKASLFIDGGMVTSEIVIEGLTIQGVGTTAVYVGMDAKPRIRSCVLSAQPGPGKPITAMKINAKAEPDVERCLLDGGESGDAGGVGLDLTTAIGSVSVRDSLILGGSAKGAAACGSSWVSAGVLLPTAGGSVTLSGNQIRGGSVQAAGCLQDSSVVGGVVTRATGQNSPDAFDLTLDGNVIDGGTSSSAGRRAGVFLRFAGSLKVDRSRIYGGSIEADNLDADTVGLQVEGSPQSVLVTNSIVHAGNRSALLARSTTGVALLAGQDVVLFHDTVYAGGMKAEAPTSSTVRALHLGPKAALPKVRVDKDYLLVSPTSGGLRQGVLLDQCAPDVGSFRSNFFLGGSPIVAFSSLAPSCDLSAAPDLSSAEQVPLLFDSDCKPNMPMTPCRAVPMATLSSSCQPGQPFCLFLPGCDVTSPGACEKKLFKDWSYEDRGVTDLIGPVASAQSPLLPGFDELGWRINASKMLPCPLTDAVGDGQEEPLAVDLFGTKRVAYSPGAEELDPKECAGMQ